MISPRKRPSVQLSCPAPVLRSLYAGRLFGTDLAVVPPIDCFNRFALFLRATIGVTCRARFVRWIVLVNRKSTSAWPIEKWLLNCARFSIISRNSTRLCNSCIVDAFPQVFDRWCNILCGVGGIWRALLLSQGGSLNCLSVRLSLLLGRRCRIDKTSLLWDTRYNFATVEGLRRFVIRFHPEHLPEFDRGVRAWGRGSNYVHLRRSNTAS